MTSGKRRDGRACPLDQAGNVELAWSDAVERREVAAQHMVEGIDHAGPLQGPQVGDLLNHHDHAPITARVLADGAGADSVDVSAVCALDDLLRRRVKRRRQWLQQILPPLDERQRRLARRAVAEPR